MTPQSRGSQLAGIVLPPAPGRRPRRSLDLCAAPGAKTAQLAARTPASTSWSPSTSTQARAAGAARQPRPSRRRRASRSSTADAGDLPPDVRGRASTPCCSTRPCTRPRHPRLARRPALAPPRRRRRAAWRRAARSARRGGALRASRRRPHLRRLHGHAGRDAGRRRRALLAGGGWALDDLGAAFPERAHPANGACLLTLAAGWGGTGFFVARLRRGPDAARRARMKARRPATPRRRPWR